MNEKTCKIKTYVITISAVVALRAAGLASSQADADAPPAVRYLDGVRAEVDAARRDLPRLTRLAEQMAKKLLAGGELYAPPVAPWWQSELCGRAGGPMRVARDVSRASKRDVAIFALPHPALATIETVSAIQYALKSDADVYVLGPESLLDDYRTSTGQLIGGTQHVASLGGPTIGAGLHKRDRLPPLAPYRPVIEMVRGWAFIGELVGACTRGGKMPTMYQSIFMAGARERNASFKVKTGRQAGQVPLFHSDRSVPPVPPGKLGGAYIDTIAQYLHVLRKQARAFAKGARWMGEARRAGHRVVAVAQGHAPVHLVGRKSGTEPPIDFYPGDYTSGVVPHAKAGDTVVALCYAPISADEVLATLSKGCKVIIACPYGLPATLKDRPNLLWLNTAWKVGDAAVAVPGYDVKILPASAVMQMSSLYALIAEMAERNESPTSGR